MSKDLIHDHAAAKPSINFDATAPRNSSSPNAHGYVVQFYEDDAPFLDDLSRFIGSALEAGDAAIIIATKPHRHGLAQRLNARGLDIALAVKNDRYISLDAAETMSKFMVKGWPDVARFVDVAGNVITRAKVAVKGEHPRVVAFGEMVALLLAEGKPEQAIKLEQLWNDLVHTHKFYLHCHCAYPLSSFQREEDGERLRQICGEHSSVIPTESYTSLLSEEERLRSIALLQHKAQITDAEVAQRKKVEKSLIRSEANLADFLENAVEGVQQVGPDQRILWANKALMNLLGYTAEEYLGRPLASFHVYKHVFDEFWARLMRRETVWDFPAELRCKDGSVKQVRLHSNGLWERGEFLHTRCFIRDVTEQKKMQEALRLSEERLRLTQKAAKIGSWELDLDTEEYIWSDEVFAMFGLTPTAIKPTHKDFLSMMYFSTDRENVEKALHKAMSKNKEYETQFRILRPDGQTRWIAARGKPFFNQGRNVVLGVFIDMAEKAMSADILSAADSNTPIKSKRRAN